MKETVLVTGGTGYIAGHIIQKLLDNDYKVKTTVRDLNQKARYQHLLNMIQAKDNLEVVQADILDAEIWNSIVIGVDYVMHVASPVLFGKFKNPYEQLIKPAVEGTKNVLNACYKAKVKKIVVTSSAVAIENGKVLTEYDESMWGLDNTNLIYGNSKVLAEKAAWEVYNKNNKSIPLTTICPVWVIGPMLGPGEFESSAFVKRYMRGEMPINLHLYISHVDVRDVALAHMRAIQNPQSDGKRYILSESHTSLKEMTDILREEFGKFGYKFPTGQASYCVYRTISLFISELRFFKDYYGMKQLYKNQRSVQDLGLTYMNTRESIKTLAYDLIRFKQVPDKTKPKQS